MAQTKPLTEALLAELQPSAKVYRGWAQCLEDCTMEGRWNVNSTAWSTLDPPAGVPANTGNSWMLGYLDVYRRSPDVVQILHHVESNFSYKRVFRGGVWSPWKKYMLE